MYQLKKTAPFEDDIELLDESGKVVRTIHISLCLDKLLARYNETINALKAAEIAIDPKDEQSLEAYGQIVMQLLGGDVKEALTLFHKNSSYTH